MMSPEGLAADARQWAGKMEHVPVIVDRATCADAMEYLKSLRGLRQTIAKWFEPHVEGAMETKRQAEANRKALVEEQARVEAPLVAAEDQIKRRLLEWEAKEERERLAEEQRLQREAQARADAATLEAAAALERDAVTTGDAGMLAEAHDLIAQPIQATAVFVPSSMPKVRGVVYRDHWKAHPTVDVRKLAAAVAAGLVSEKLLIPNMPALNALAKTGQDVPGVRFVNDRQIATQGRV